MPDLARWSSTSVVFTARARAKCDVASSITIEGWSGRDVERGEALVVAQDGGEGDEAGGVEATVGESEALQHVIALRELGYRHAARAAHLVAAQLQLLDRGVDLEAAAEGLHSGGIEVVLGEIERLDLAVLFEQLLKRLRAARADLVVREVDRREWVAILERHSEWCEVEVDEAIVEELDGAVAIQVQLRRARCVALRYGHDLARPARLAGALVHRGHLGGPKSFDVPDPLALCVCVAGWNSHTPRGGGAVCGVVAR